MTTKKSPKKIIVIGAGIAGLAACSRLIELGFDAKIIEARNRCGGRILTDNTLGIPFGLGASWIHGDKANPISQLAKSYGAQKVVVDPNKYIMLDRNGSSYSQDEIQKFNIKLDTLTKQASEIAFLSKNDIPLSVALSSAIKKNKLNSIEQGLLDIKCLSLESYFGAGYESLSARNYEQGEIS